MVVQNGAENEAKEKSIWALLRLDVTKRSQALRWRVPAQLHRLFEGMDELQAEETDVASHVLPQNPGKDGGRLTRNKAVRSR
ncbi:MAG TPA: hypothetical protein VJN92_14910 [Candidatus Acidoferrum sp.]|nr:hypothetical protein [Candidatus Acidoferrum sp.]